MGKYIDAIIELNNGLASLVSEFLADDSVKSLVTKDGETQEVTGINLNNFPVDKDLTKKRLVYIRVKQDVADLLQSKNFLNKKILAMCPAGGEVDLETGEVKSIYQLLQEDDNALSTYNKYCFHPATVEDEEGVTIPNPLVGQFRPLGRFA